MAKGVILILSLFIILGISVFIILNNKDQPNIINEVNLVASPIFCDYESLGIHKNYTITCCGSMSPSINDSDQITLVPINSENPISIGSVVQVKTLDNQLLIHRLIKINNSDSLNPMCKTKGDNNVDVDDWTYCSLIKWKVACVNGWKIQ